MNDKYTCTERVPDRVLELYYVDPSDMQSVFSFISHLKTKYKPEGRVLVEIRHVGTYTGLNGDYRVEKEVRVEWDYDATCVIPGEYLAYFPATNVMEALTQAELANMDIERKTQS